MRGLRKLGAGLLTIGVVAGASLFFQTHDNAPVAANSLPGDNEVITIKTTDGQPVDASIFIRGYSADGNVILFSAIGATNLPDHNGISGLYTYNIKSDSTVRIDVSSGGTAANGSFNANAVISETGRFVVFMSNGTNLVDGTTTTGLVYMRDVQTGTTIATGGSDRHLVGAGNNWDRNLGVSNDGEFQLTASRFIENSYPNDFGILVGQRDGSAYDWTRLATSQHFSATTGSLSCEGAFAVFKVNQIIRLVDFRRGEIKTLTQGGSHSLSPIISCNGRYILYATTNRTDIIPTPSGMNTLYQLVQYDRISGERKYINSNAAGVFRSKPIPSSIAPPPPNIFSASVADTGDVVFNYGNFAHLKRLSDGSGSLEKVAKTATGTYIDVTSATITSDARHIFFQADPYDLGLAPSPQGTQVIRAKTGI